MKRWVAVGISLFLITLLAGTVVGKEEVVWSFGHHHSLLSSPLIDLDIPCAHDKV